MATVWLYGLFIPRYYKRRLKEQNWSGQRRQKKEIYKQTYIYVQKRQAIENNVTYYVIVLILVCIKHLFRIS